MYKINCLFFANNAYVKLQPKPKAAVGYDAGSKGI